MNTTRTREAERRTWRVLPALRRLMAAVRPPLAAVELAAITLLGLLYVLLFAPQPLIAAPDGLDTARLERILFDESLRFAGLEHERLAGVLLPVRIGLERYGHIPAWNPYLAGGTPLLNNAFSYLFNPFHSLPVLLLGGVTGSKLAVVLALWIAGGAMWALARAIGLGAVARVTAGALYLMSGGIAGKFFTGHFQLGLSLAWPPLVFAGLWWTLRSRDRRAPVLFAVAFALLFFAGNIYYTLHTLIGCAVIVALHLVECEGGRWRWRGERLRRAVIGGGFAFGLAALQFMLVVAVGSPRFIIHDTQPFTADGALAGRYSLGQAAANLIYPWDAWRIFQTPGYQQDPVVDYAYIGAAPFLLMAAALVLGRARRIPLRAALAALVLAPLMMTWGAGQTPLLEALYRDIRLMQEFRFMGRALAIAALWWIVLAAIAVDALWRAARALPRTPPAFDRLDRGRWLWALTLATLAWAYLLVYSLAGISTRLSLALGQPGLLTWLDGLRFTSFQQALGGLWSLLWLALAADTLLRVAAQVGRFIWRAPGPVWRPVWTRLLRLGVFTVILAALVDIAQVNSRLFVFERLPADFTPLYAYVREHDPTPFPAISHPFSARAFDAYTAEVRNWGLDEGWRPGAPIGVIPLEAGPLPDLPRWAIVSNFYGQVSRDYAQDFVGQLGYERRLCILLVPQPGDPDPCAVEGSAPVAVLYERPDALPYAFIVSAERLFRDASSLRAEEVLLAQVISHQQDTIFIQATVPGDSAAPAHFLIVRENHFPGWAASLDGVPTATVTAETSFSTNMYQGYVAVALPPGQHTVRLSYQPPGLMIGVTLFVVTLVAMALYLFGPRFKRM